LKSDFKTNSQKWSPHSKDVSRATSGSLPWRSRLQHDFEAKLCPPIASISEVGFYNYFIEMITILWRRLANNIRVATLKVKVTVWPWSQIVSGLRYLKSYFTAIPHKWSPYRRFSSRVTYVVFLSFRENEV
jgi:hypothetical protein